MADESTPLDAVEKLASTVGKKLESIRAMGDLVRGKTRGRKERPLPVFSEQNPAPHPGRSGGSDPEKKETAPKQDPFQKTFLELFRILVNTVKGAKPAGATAQDPARSQANQFKELLTAIKARDDDRDRKVAEREEARIAREEERDKKRIDREEASARKKEEELIRRREDKEQARADREKKLQDDRARKEAEQLRKEEDLQRRKEAAEKDRQDKEAKRLEALSAVNDTNFMRELQKELEKVEKPADHRNVDDRARDEALGMKTSEIQERAKQGQLERARRQIDPEYAAGKKYQERQDRMQSFKDLIFNPDASQQKMEEEKRATGKASAGTTLAAGLGGISKGMQGGNDLSSGGDLLGGAGKMASMIPGIGPAIGGVMKFGDMALKSADKLKEMGQNLHNANMEFAEFSGLMAQVQAEADVREFERKQKQGDNRADSASKLNDSLQDFKDNLAPIEDALANLKNTVMTGILKGVNGLFSVTKKILGIQEKNDKDKNEKFEEWGLDLAKDTWWKNYPDAHENREARRNGIRPRPINDDEGL